MVKYCTKYPPNRGNHRRSGADKLIFPETSRTRQQIVYDADMPNGGIGQICRKRTRFSQVEFSIMKANEI